MTLPEIGKSLMAEPPLTRLRGRTSQADVRARNDTALERAMAESMDRHPADPADEREDHRRFWSSLAEDLDEHAAGMDQHSRKAKKLAEVVRTVITTKKVAGRVVPNSTNYTQTITRKSDTPFTKT